MDRHSHVAATAATGGALLALAAERLLAMFIAKTRRPRQAEDRSDGTVTSLESLRRPPPHPAWHPPQKLPPPYATASAAPAMHTVDPATTPADVLYPLVISAVVPRPIAFVSTRSPEGVGNLAPYSYFNVVAHDPPHVAIGFCATRLREHGNKDSLVNVLATKELVVNIISEWFVEAANHCCGAFDYGDDEMALSGLTPLPSSKVAPPRVAESAVQMECVVRHFYQVENAAGRVSTTIVIAEVVLMHVAEGVAGRSPSGKLVVDVAKLQPVSRLGGNTYGRSEGLFDLPRPDRTAAAAVAGANRAAPA